MLGLHLPAEGLPLVASRLLPGRLRDRGRHVAQKAVVHRLMNRRLDRRSGPQVHLSDPGADDVTGILGPLQ